MPFGLDPLIFGLMVGLVLGAIIEILIVLGPGRYFIAKKARKENLDSLEAGEWDPALERILEPLKKQITNEIGGFEARFSVSYTKDMETIQENMRTEIKEIPRRVSGIIHGAEGVEEKAFRSMAEAAETEVEGEISVMEAVASQNPEMTQIAIAQKIQKLGSDEEWQKEHQIGSLILEIGKPTLLNWVREMTRQMQGTPRLGPGNTTARKQFSSPYG